jgi:hypothetical protein
MKKLLLLFLPVFTLALNAQKPSYSSFYVYYAVPAYIGLKPEVKTFTVHYHGTLLSAKDMDYLFKYELEFPGMKRVEENGDLQIHFDYPNPVIISKSGSSVKLLPTVLVYVKESASKNILYHDLVNGDPMTITTDKSEFPIGTDLAKINDNSIYKKEAAEEFLAKTKDGVNKSISTFKELYFYETKLVKLTFMGGKGSFDYAELDASFEALKSAKDLAKEGKFEEYKQVAKDQIAIWEKWLAEEDASNSKAKVSKDVADGLKLSIANGNFILGKADVAMEMTDQLIDKSYASKTRPWALNARLSYSAVESRAKAASTGNFSLMDYYKLKSQEASKVPEGAQSSGAMSALYKLGSVSAEANSKNENNEAPGLFGAWKHEDDQYFYDYYFLSNYEIFTVTTKKENKQKISIRKQYWRTNTNDEKLYLLIRDDDAKFKESPTSKQLSFDMLFQVMQGDKNSIVLSDENSDKKIKLSR